MGSGQASEVAVGGTNFRWEFGILWAGQLLHDPSLSLGGHWKPQQPAIVIREGRRYDHGNEVDVRSIRSARTWGIAPE